MRNAEIPVMRGFLRRGGGSGGKRRNRCSRLSLFEQGQSEQKSDRRRLWIEFVGAAQCIDRFCMRPLCAQHHAEDAPVIGALPLQRHGESRCFDGRLKILPATIVAGDQRLCQAGVCGSVIGAACNSDAQFGSGGIRLTDPHEHVTEPEANDGIVRRGGDCTFKCGARCGEMIERQMIIGKFRPPLRRAGIVHHAAELFDGFGTLTDGAQRTRQQTSVLRFSRLQGNCALGALQCRRRLSQVDQGFGEQRVTFGVARVAA
jgi:hypothetical protein